MLALTVRRFTRILHPRHHPMADDAAGRRQKVPNRWRIRTKDIRESLQRLFPVRIATMHARLTTRDDELLLLVEPKRVLKAIGRRWIARLKPASAMGYTGARHLATQCWCTSPQVRRAFVRLSKDHWRCGAASAEI